MKNIKSIIGSYIRDIQELSKVLIKSNFQHVKRSANEKAHGLASNGLKMGEDAKLPQS